jgi:hypothetical protein
LTFSITFESKKIHFSGSLSSTSLTVWRRSS